MLLASHLWDLHVNLVRSDRCGVSDRGSEVRFSATERGSPG